MVKIVKELTGHSGSTIHLLEDNRGLFVRKVNNVERNVERLTALYAAGYPVPKIYNWQDNCLDMEYIHGLDMKTYLIHNGIHSLVDFINKTIKSFYKYSKDKDYTAVYSRKLNWITTESELPFTKEELIDRLPKILPCSMYHGDMTLENILYTDTGFNMIDPVTVEYDSYVFDIAKMRQDLECKWFLRNEGVRLDTKLQNIQDNLKELYPNAFDDSLLILMLLRVYLHTTKGDANYNFIMKEVNRLWLKCT